MWLTVKEIKEKYNKSESSVRRLIKGLKIDDLTKLKFETLENGMQKVYVDAQYLNSVFNKEKKEYSNSSSSNGSSDITNYLMNELAEKNKQIEQLHVMLNNAQNQNQLLLQLDTPGQTTKKRWWQRKK
jgi:DNA-binding MurR/RpiR family transcriptional regulator